MREIEGNIFVVGAGSMAEAFIRGITERGAVLPEQIYVVNRSRSERLMWMQETYGITPVTSFEAAGDARLVVIAVKPYDVAEAITAVAPYLNTQPILSFAAGVTIAFMQSLVGGSSPVVRTMPNIPVAVLSGATAVSFSEDVPVTDKSDILHLLRQVGDVVEISEGLMDAATAFSGSGPGFVCYFLESMENAAVELGFTPEVARRLLLQTVVGTAKTLDEWGLSPLELRQRVTSPNGTTFAGVSAMETAGLPDLVQSALRAAADRSKEMGRQFAVKP